MKFPKVDEHPTRQQLLQAARTGRVPFRRHLERCEACAQTLEHLTTLAAMERAPLEEPSEDALERMMAAPLLADARRSGKNRSGRLTFDSWADLSRAQLRDLGKGAERRLTLEAGTVVLKLVAQRRGYDWEFTGRVYVDGRASSDYVLRVGRRDLVPETHACYFWKSSRPPRRLKLASPETTIDFGSLTWA